MQVKLSDIDWSAFDGLEVSPCIEEDDEDGGYCERCTEDEAHFWTVYGHCITGGVESLWDFPTKETALVWANELTRQHAGLHTYGIAVYD
jgi:hypothetical protein